MLAFHPLDGSRAYQAGGTRGGALSRDAGASWRRLPGLDRGYGWSIAADTARPDLVYLAAAHTRTAHGTRCDAAVFRTEGASWEQLAGGLPSRIAALPVLAVGNPGEVYAALGGEVWLSVDHGDIRQRLGVDLGGRPRALIVF